MIPFVGGSYTLAVRRADVQRTVNMYPVVAEDEGSHSPTYLAQIPGLDVFSDVPVVPPGGFDIGWLNPITSIDDPNTSSIENSGAPQDENNPFGFTAYGALAPYVSSGDAVEYSLSWEQLGEGVAPTFGIDVLPYGTVQIDFHPVAGPGTNLTVGVATITATVGGVPCIGYLTFTCAESTGGSYGNIAWEHHVGTSP